MFIYFIIYLKAWVAPPNMKIPARTLVYTIHCHMVQNDAKSMLYNHYYENSNFLVPFLVPLVVPLEVLDVLQEVLL